jgi:hypothetical protein
VKSSIQRQQGAAAKEIILVLLFLILAAYMAVVGVKASLSTASEGGPSGTASMQRVGSDDSLIRNASMVNGIGLGLLLATLVTGIGSKPSPDELRSPIAKKYIRVNSLTSILGCIFVGAGGLMYFSAGFQTALIFPLLGFLFAIPAIMNLIKE